MVYQEMVEGYSLKVGVPARRSFTLQSLFVELYSSFKNGIRGLSLLVGALKCPENYDGCDDKVIDYTLSLLEYLCPSKKVLRILLKHCSQLS
jgi:hypothetical protein